MSVLKSRRRESKAEFVNVTYDIYCETLTFMARLSNRYQRLLSADTMRMASLALDHAEMAQNTYVCDKATYELRETHLSEARAAVMALDVHMTQVWHAMMKNPQGCFTNTKGETKQPAEAVKILEKMAESLGEKIDRAKNLITKALESDRKRHKGYASI